VDFEDYVRQRYPSLRRLGFLLSADWAVADDLVQTALIRCERRWTQIAGADADPYVRRAVVNTANTWRLRRRLHAPLSALDSCVAPSSDSDERLAVVAALRALPLGQRQVLVLRFYEGLPEAEIAEVLGISPGTVKSRAARGLSALRRSDLRELAPHGAGA
jgi:RNA polymerase sigma-70 factor (sigma-E family)